MILICPKTLIQAKIKSNRPEATILYSHPDSESLSAINNNENSIYRLHGLLTYFNMIEPLKDISEHPQRVKIFSGIDLKHSDIDQLNKVIPYKKQPGININIGSKGITKILLNIISGDIGETIEPTKTNGYMYQELKRKRDQNMRTLIKLIGGTRFNKLAYPKDREQAKQFAEKIPSNGNEKSQRVKTLLLSLSDNVTFTEDSALNVDDIIGVN